MKKVGNNRQKLILNRQTKVEAQMSPQKLLIHIVNFNKISPLKNSLLEKKNENMIIQLKSSFVKDNIIEKKEIQDFIKIKQNCSKKYQRCKSFSAMGNSLNLKKQKMHNSQKISQKTIQKKTIKMVNLEPIIHTLCKQMIAKSKENGVLALKDKNYSIKCDNFYQIVAEVAKKTIEQTKKVSMKVLEASHPTIKQFFPRKRPQLTISSQFSFFRVENKTKNLQFSSSNINFHTKQNQSRDQKQIFWRIVENIEQQIPTQQNLNFLLHKYKYLKKEISHQQKQSQRLSQNIEFLGQKICSQTKDVQGLRKQINEQEAYLLVIEQKVREINQFAKTQPNKILRSQAEGYKEREQQLFDEAFLLQQSVPIYIDSFIGDSILIQNQSFKLTLKSFPYHKVSQENHYKITEKEISAFKASLQNAYESIVEKLSSIIENKFEKIKNVVGIMRRLASYTIGKRQYLAQINKKMAIVSTKVDKHLEKIQNQELKHNESSEFIVNTKQLYDSLRSLYYQAEIFY